MTDFTKGAEAMQEMAAKLRLPWKWLPDEGQFIIDARGQIVAEVPCQGVENDKLIGAAIVRAVNALPSQPEESSARGGADYTRLRRIIEHRLANMHSGNGPAQLEAAASIAQSELSDVLAAFDAGEVIPAQPEAQGGTPRTDAAIAECLAESKYEPPLTPLVNVARQLERELAAAKRGVVGQMGEIYIKYFDRLNDAVEEDSIEKIVSELLAETNAMLSPAPQQIAAPVED